MAIPSKLNNLSILSLALVVASSLWAGDSVSPPDTGKPLVQALERQRQAVASMAASLAVQRRSVQAQVGQQPRQSFFNLPPLPRVAASVPPPAEPVSDCPPLPSTELDSLIEHAAQREALLPDLLRGVIQQESAARPCAVSSKGAMGLMQLMPSTAQQLGVRDAFDPRENVDAGARFLKQLLNQYGGDVSLALGAFNAGPGRVNQAGGLPDFPETIDYVQKVLAFLP
jgi:soluble lytic murein transglycosylase-like protein